MADHFPVPIQVSDGDSSDGQRPAVPLPMTGRPVSPPRLLPPANVPPQTAAISSGGDLTSQNLQVDAARDNRPAPSYQHNARDGGGAADIIEIKDGKRSIVMKGVMSTVRPGVNVQIGAVTHMTVHQHGRHSAVMSSVPNAKPTQRITDSQASPSPRHLEMVSSHIGGEWRQLGRSLGMTDAVLDQIYLDHHAHGQREINYQCLRRWTQQRGRTLHTLAQVLADIGRGDLADMLSGES